MAFELEKRDIGYHEVSQKKIYIRQHIILGVRSEPKEKIKQDMIATGCQI